MTITPDEQAVDHARPGRQADEATALEQLLASTGPVANPRRTRLADRSPERAA